MNAARGGMAGQMRADQMRAGQMRAIVVTVSDGCWAGRREDGSGPAVARLLEAAGFSVERCVLLPDEREQIAALFCEIAEETGEAESRARLVVTTGGTGIGERDVTPEATREVCDRVLEGVGEQMRREGARHTPLAALSRGVCGTRGRTLILNLPGSPQGAVQSLEAVMELLPHALAMLGGNTEHAAATMDARAKAE